MCSTKTFLGQEIFLEKDIKICVSFLLVIFLWLCSKRLDYNYLYFDLLVLEKNLVIEAESNFQ